MKTVKLTEEAYEILSIIKWSTKSKTFSKTILQMDKAIITFAPKDHNANRIAIKGIKL